MMFDADQEAHDRDTYRINNPIVRAVELARVAEQRRLHERERFIDAACDGADEALRQFAAAISPVPVRLLVEVPGEKCAKEAVPRDGAEKLLELRIGKPGGARTLGEFHLDLNWPAAPWRLISKRPQTLDFKTFEELLVGLTTRPDFGANYTAALAHVDEKDDPRIVRFQTPHGVLELHVPEHRRTPTWLPALGRGALYGTVCMVLLRWVLGVF